MAALCDSRVASRRALSVGATPALGAHLSLTIDAGAGWLIGKRSCVLA
jgi:hypothetical protein